MDSRSLISEKRIINESDDKHMRKKTIHELLANIYYHVPEMDDAITEEYYEDLTTMEMHILRAVAACKPDSAAEVARILHISTSALEKSLSALEEKGYIVREMQLTEKSEKVLETYNKIIRNGISEVVKEMTDEEVDAIIKGLGILEGYIEHMMDK